MPCETAERCDNLQSVQGITFLPTNPATESVDFASTTAVIDGWTRFREGGTTITERTFHAVRIGGSVYIEWTVGDGTNDPTPDSDMVSLGETDFEPSLMGLTPEHMGGEMQNGPDGVPVVSNLEEYDGYATSGTRSFHVAGIALIEGDSTFEWDVDYDLEPEPCE